MSATIQADPYPDVIVTRIGAARNLLELRRLLKSIPTPPVGYTQVEGEFGGAIELTLVDIGGKQTLQLHEGK